MALPGWAQQNTENEKFSHRGNVLASGIGYNVISALFQVLGSFVSILILSRFLSAEDFGIYGMIMPFMTILLMVTDGGTVYYTLREARLREADLSFTFWYCSVLGIGLAVLLWIAAPFIAWLMDEPRLIPVAFVMGGALFFASTGSQHYALIMRCFRNDLRTIVIVGSISISVGLAVWLAWAGYGYWALVLLLVSRVVLNTTLCWILTGWRPRRPRWNPGLLKNIMRLGNAEMMSRLLISGIRESDRIIVGILFSTTLTGYYALAYMLSMMPLVQLTAPLLLVILPYLGEQKDSPDQLFGTFRTFQQAFIFIFWPWCLFVVIFARDLLQVVIGADMLPSADIFPILVVGAMLTTTISFISLPFQAIDRPDITRRYNFMMAVVFVIALAAAAQFGTPVAIAWAVTGANALAFVIRFVVLARHFNYAVASELRALAPVLALTGILPLLIVALDRGFALADRFDTALAHVLVLVAGFALLHGAAGWITLRKSLLPLLFQRG